MQGRTLIIGTRGSQLALEQARRVEAGLAGPSEVRVVRTSGDRFKDQPLGDQNPVGFFTKEIEDELLTGQIDLAVHSLKDLPIKLAPGLDFGALLARDEPSDILLVRPDKLDAERTLPLVEGARVGASSMRRQSLLGMHRPDVEPAAIRGNVTTRIEKAARGDYDAIILSRAGLERLGLEVAPLVPYEFNPERWPGAPGQAVIAVEIRAGDTEVRERLEALEDARTRTRVDAERSLLLAYGGGCHAPFGAWAAEAGGTLVVAAPIADRSFGVQRFEGADLAAARKDAENWILAGRPARDGDEGELWVCRPARPWC